MPPQTAAAAEARVEGEERTGGEAQRGALHDPHTRCSSHPTACPWAPHSSSPTHTTHTTPTHLLHQALDLALMQRRGQPVHQLSQVVRAVLKDKENRVQAGSCAVGCWQGSRGWLGDGGWARAI